MHLKRRHFLQLGGGFLAGLGVGAIAQPLQAEQAIAQAPARRIYNPPRGDVRIGVISDLNSRYGSTDYTGLQFVDRAGFPFYYTFQQKEVFYLVWDASTAAIPPAQIAWADRALASPTAQQAKLRIVIGHLPLYTIAVGRDEPGEYLNRADQLRALLERHRVHTYISGHHHAYYPGHVGALQTLHCGILGSGMRPLLNGDLRPTKTLTVVDVNLTTADTTYTTYDMQSLTVFAPQQLPKLIVGPNGRVLRRDVTWEELTPAEQATEYIPSY